MKRFYIYYQTERGFNAMVYIDQVSLEAAAVEFRKFNPKCRIDNITTK